MNIGLLGTQHGGMHQHARRHIEGLGRVWFTLHFTTLSYGTRKAQMRFSEKDAEKILRRVPKVKT